MEGAGIGESIRLLVRARQYFVVGFWAWAVKALQEIIHGDGGAHALQGLIYPQLLINVLALAGLDLDIG